MRTETTNRIKALMTSNGWNPQFFKFYEDGRIWCYEDKIGKAVATLLQENGIACKLDERSDARIHVEDTDGDV